MTGKPVCHQMREPEIYNIKPKIKRLFYFPFCYLNSFFFCIFVFNLISLVMLYADVIVPLAVDGMYTYAVPVALEKVVKPGCLVLVAFAGNKKYTAIVGRLHEQKPEGFEVRAIEGIAEEEVWFSPLHLKFLMWVSGYYMATLGEIIKAALPVILRLESYTSVARTEEDINFSDLTIPEQTLLNFLHPGEYVALREAEKVLNLKSGITVVKSLLARNYIRIKETVDDLFRTKTESVVSWAHRFSEEELGEMLELLKKAPAQHRLLCHWIERGGTGTERSELLEESGCSLAVLKSLCGKNILKIEERPVSRFREGGTGGPGPLHELTGEQERALNETRKLFREKDCVLLKGVTSSGKTEVYIRLIREYLERGQQVLYMLPEIALTLQIVRRLQNVFGEDVGIYHSGMSDQMRAELWKRQCGKAPFGLVLGVRSSVFLPFQHLGLIIVDEEHDASYKQKEPAPRYQGRDAAIMLAKMAGARVLLGSATPSFESWHNALQGKYGLVQMNHRYGGIQMPEIIMADLKEYRRKKVMQGSFTPLLVKEIQRVLAEGMQVILFQNRRGYASYLQCERCGSIPKCRFCDVSMTYYKQRQVLVCRYCGAIVRMEECCPDCGGHYKERVPGTEKVEEEVKKLFPEGRIARMDMDVMSSKARFRKVIDDFEQGKTNILIGTQMVTKGLDFERVKLVGVMDADSMICFPDFRAEERAYCMLMQVSGRSGRKGERGKVIIQASDVENRIYTLLTNGDYPAFFFQLTDERRMFVYPPFGRIIQVEMRHKEVVILRKAANQLAGRLREKLGKRVCGPAVPEVSRIGGQNRLILIIKIEPALSGATVKTLLKTEFSFLKENKAWGSLRLFCDVDP